jgi:hypothetical protein
MFVRRVKDTLQNLKPGLCPNDNVFRMCKDGSNWSMFLDEELRQDLFRIIVDSPVSNQFYFPLLSICCSPLIIVNELAPVTPIVTILRGKPNWDTPAVSRPIKQAKRPHFVLSHSIDGIPSFTFNNNT